MEKQTFGGITEAEQGEFEERQERIRALFGLINKWLRHIKDVYRMI